MSIVVFGGTVEGRKIAEFFQGTETEVHLCVATEYGASLLPEEESLRVHAGRMEEKEMEEFLDRIRPDYCIDATHPYAEIVTENIRTACKSLGICDLRVIRREGELQEEDNVRYFDQIEDVVSYLNGTKGKILLTTGSRDLEAYTRISDYRSRCVARVLPVCSVMEKCKGLGFEGRNLIGMQGPFSEEMNYAILKQMHASWLVTKDSGTEGGFLEKYLAAKRAGVKLAVIGRPRGGKEGKTLEETLAFLKERYGMEKKRQVFLIGMGPGDPSLLTGEAKQAVGSCEVLIGSKRMLESCNPFQKPDCLNVISWNREEILDFVREHGEYERVGIVYSGDIGFYSGAKGMMRELPQCEVHPVSGISSADYLLGRMGLCREEVFVTSCHGREMFLIPLIVSRRWVCVLAGSRDLLQELCKQLLDFQMEEVKITVGESLSYERERILSGRPVELLSQKIEPLSVILIENPGFCERKIGFGIKDQEFLRGRVPMTKEEVRILSLSKLNLRRDSTLYDIGAGTGSVSIEAARQCEAGCVYAIEREEEALSLIRENQIRFRVQNLILTRGTAPDCLKELPAPSHVFVGGSGGNLSGIISAVREKNRGVRIVINTVTLETLTEVWRLRDELENGREMEVLQIQVSKGRELGGYHLISAQNPVFIISFGGEGETQNER